MNLAAHPDNKRAIAAANAIAALVPMLSQGGGPAEQAAGALMNLASNNALNQASIVKAEALSPLVALLQTAARPVPPPPPPVPPPDSSPHRASAPLPSRRPRAASRRRGGRASMPRAR